MRTKLVIAAVGLLIAAIASFWTMNGGVPVEAARVHVGPIHEFVEERGKTRLPQVYAVTMPYDARIGAIELIEGAPVRKGQILAQLVPKDVQLATRAAQAAVERLEAVIHENDDIRVDETSLEQALKTLESTTHTVEAARAQTESAKAKLDLVNRNLTRVRSLREKNATSEEAWDQAQLAQVEAAMRYQHDLLQLRSLEASNGATSLQPQMIRQTMAHKELTHNVLGKQLAEAQVRLEQAQTDAERGVLMSPVDGVVLERLISDEKRTVAGTVLLTIGRPEDLEVEAEILSQEVVAIELNDPAEISGPAIGQQPVHGKVKRIYPAGFTKISSLGVEQQRVKVIIGFEPSDLERLRRERGLGPEYRVRVRVFTASNPKATVVPRSALFRGPDGSWRVFAVRAGRVQLQVVETGLMNDESVEISKGLASEDVVVLAPESNLTEGMTVRPNFREIVETRPVTSRDD